MKNNSIIIGVIEIILDFFEQVFVFIIFPGLLYFLIGFFYHYYRNKTYLNIIIESIIIGFLFGFFTRVEGVGWIEWTIICILIVLFSGFFARIIRESSNSKSAENDYKKDNKTDYNANIKRITYKEHKLKKENNIEDKVLKLHLKKKQEDVENLIQQLNDNRWQRRYKAIISLMNIGDSTAIDDVRKLLDDENHTVQETAATYLRLNDAFPKTRLEDIELYPYSIEKPYTRIKRISAHSDYSLDSKAVKIEDVDSKLREEAANLGANAIIGVNHTYNIFKRNKILKGQGSAVLIKDLKNVEKAKDSGWIFFYWGLFCILQFFKYDLLIFIPVGIFTIIYGFFVRRGYKNKTYLLSFLSVVILSAAIWTYNILKNGFKYPDFYIITSIFVITIVIFFYEYLKRKNNTNLPWKDQWGFN
ncbi:MAG: hypothetical protein CVV28_09340 [Methanobacteriales archaeon HGW-Methanobacteriales-1]|jgi:hypothetical protein|nr:MAG: hypothetical protein CVV28_09340 [Methanobacteriales archaeon HGW-Methanobacteriales-1]